MTETAFNPLKNR
jgi:actin